MKHIKPLKEFFFFNQPELLKKKFNSPTSPSLPFKRDLTDDESEIMLKAFPTHSFSNIDSEGRILLGGGMGDEALFYITEDDLEELKKK